MPKQPVYLNDTVHTLLHTLWTNAVGTENYNKEEFILLQQLIHKYIPKDKTINELLDNKGKV